jgi:hypothetical protein
MNSATSYYVVKYGCTWLSDFGECWTRWVSTRTDARRYASKAECELVAYAVGGHPEECVEAN